MIRKLRWMVVLMFLIFGFSGCQQVHKDETGNHSTTIKAIENGKLALADGDYTKAKNNFQLALAENKEHQEAADFFTLAGQMESLEKHIENKQFKKAQEVITKIKKNDLFDIVKSQIDDYESILADEKSLTQNIDHEITTLSKLLEQENFDKVIEAGEQLKVAGNISKSQLEKINDIIKKAKDKQKAVANQQQKPSQASGPQQNQQGNFTYQTYTNSRFGFTVQYPTTFTAYPPPTNNDGREFSNEEATITAYGSHINVLGENETIETYYQRALADAPGPVTYKALGNDWYVVSYRAGTNTVYEKAIIGETIISKVIITYPSSKQAYYDSMVTHVSKTFKGGKNELVW